MNSNTTTRRSNCLVLGRVKLDDEDLRGVPPHDLETERCVLGCGIFDPASIDPMHRIIGATSAMYDERHRIIWSTMQQMHIEGTGIDPVTLRAELQQRGQLENAGGVQYILQLIETVPHAVHAEHYAKIVREKFDRRRIIEGGHELVRTACDLTNDIDSVRATASSVIHSVEQTSQPRRTFAGVGAAELQVLATCEPEWLVEELFTLDEPLLVGARSKGCKTLQLTDLAVSLATGTPWMGTFEVPKRRKVLFISGETNNRRMARHIDNACRARGGSFDDLGDYLRVEAVEFPCLPSMSDQDAIRQTVKRHDIEVVICDPLYRGLTGLDATQLGEMGGAIKGFQSACSPACLVLSHHVVKSAAREYGSPPSLEDMTGAGIAESCGQWWLVGRNEKYEWNGIHDLCVGYGGREGQAGGKRIVFNERDWTFEVENLSDFINEADEDRRRQRETAKREADDRKVNQARQKIISACRNIKTPQSRTRIRDSSGQSGMTFGMAFSSLVQEQSLLQRPYKDGSGRIHSEGYILAEHAPEYEQQWSAQ